MVGMVDWAAARARMVLAFILLSLAVGGFAGAIAVFALLAWGAVAALRRLVPQAGEPRWWTLGATAPRWLVLATRQIAARPAFAVLQVSALAVGLLGYGVSLVLFVLALRGLGTARTGAYFSTAPFIGAAVSLLLLGESTSSSFWLAAALMAWGVWLHLTEHHEHEHVHEPMEHSHRHIHDAHHQHAHAFPWAGDEPHQHWHRHEAMVHKHPHFPDIHHRHSH